uniref:Uncharacterized protein n=1 Tax=Glossina morsitans morsitans TaxID=37546 RepID=A0A1B0G2H8_GLOMM
MVFIPDALFSEQLQSYPELWGLEKGYICWKVLGRKLADVLTKKTGTLITVEDVRIKLKKVKRSLKRLGNSEGTRYTGMCAYVWYAHKLGLTNAVDKMTSQMFAYGELPVEVDCGEVPVKVDCGEVPVEVDCGEVPVKVDCGEVSVEVDCGEVPVEVDCGDIQMDTKTEKPTEKQTEKQADDSPFTIESPDRYLSNNDYSYNVNRYINNMCDEGPTTSAGAARGKKDRRLEPAVNPEEGQEIEEADKVIPNIKALREVVSKLTAHDKIVQLHFAEVYTDQRSVYSRSEDRLYGCGIQKYSHTILFAQV